MLQGSYIFLEYVTWLLLFSKIYHMAPRLPRICHEERAEKLFPTLGPVCQTTTDHGYVYVDRNALH